MKRFVLLIIVILTTISVNAQEKEFQVFYDQIFKLSDDIILKHDLYIPSNGKIFPTILVRTPYGKKGVALFASYFAKQNFAVIVQDVRGKNDSKGIFVPFINEKTDGLETVNWITKQPWFNGKIGLWGSSYLGYSALLLADTQHPAIKSVFNLSGWIDGSQVNYPGDAFHQMLIIPWLLSDGRTSKLSERGADMDEMFAHTPLREAIPGDGTFIRASGKPLSIENFEVPFDYSKVNIPIFHMTGWNDFTALSTINAFQHINQASGTQQYALLGPWYHNQVYDGNNVIGDYKLPKNELFTVDDFLLLATNWFKHTLTNEAFDFGSNKSIKYYVLFANEWRYTLKWPPKAQSNTFYLHPNNRLMDMKNTTKNEKSTFIYDPKNPVITTGGANFNLFTEYVGIKDQSAIESRKDVLTFTSEAFKSDVIVVGNIEVVLYVSTEGIGTDFTSKITLVNNQGRSLNVTDQIIRLKPERLKNTINRITLTLPDTAFKIERNEKIRLQISSSNYPKFNRNPNTGDNPLDATKFISVEQSIYHSKKYPSKVNIPILKE